MNLSENIDCAEAVLEGVGLTMPQWYVTHDASFELLDELGMCARDKESIAFTIGYATAVADMSNRTLAQVDDRFDDPDAPVTS